MIALLTASLLFFASTPAEATRVKDLGSFHGFRDNQLTGAGLVVGLQRTGDSNQNLSAVRALTTRLQGLGVSLLLNDIRSRNVALVMVSASMGPGLRTGSRIDVTVASAGDAASLEGGVLLMTPLMGADGQVYALAEGPLVVGGFSASQDGASVGKNRPTVGRIAGGGLVEREVPSSVDWNGLQTVDFVLRDPDFTTATRLADAIDTAFEADVAEPQSAATVSVTIPEGLVGRFPVFAAAVEGLDITVDASTRVVVNERTGTVVMGAGAQLSPVAVAHGGLTIEVRRQNQVSQPNALAQGETKEIQNSQVMVEEKQSQLVMIEGSNVGDLVAALDKLGVSPRDLISILHAMRASGALQAEIITL